MPICPNCQAMFEVTESDLAFYDKVSPVIAGKKYLILPPTLCPDCRHQRRLAFKQAKLHVLNCGRCGKKTLSIFSTIGTELNVYCHDCWWGDDWDPIAYGQDFDFSRKFSDQFSELLYKTPRLANNAKQNVNSDYILSGHQNKNCYLLNEADYCQDAYYSYYAQSCRDSSDLMYTDNCELCYELTVARNCYHVLWASNCHDCSDSYFLSNCQNCQHCCFCHNLKVKKYCIWNKQLTREAYFEAIKAFNFTSYLSLVKIGAEYSAFLKATIVPEHNNLNVEHSLGNYLFNCKDCYNSLYLHECQNCNYCTELYHSRDCYDTDIYWGELLYESLNVGPDSYRTIAGNFGWTLSDCLYTADCHSSQFLLGCVSLRQKQFCILNKQYSQKEYEALAPKVIEHMIKTKEWGEFFPVTLSPENTSLCY